MTFSRSTGASAALAFALISVGGAAIAQGAPPGHLGEPSESVAPLGHQAGQKATATFRDKPAAGLANAASACGMTRFLKFEISLN